MCVLRLEGECHWPVALGRIHRVMWIPNARATFESLDLL